MQPNASVEVSLYISYCVNTCGSFIPEAWAMFKGRQLKCNVTIYLIDSSLIDEAE